MIGSEAAETFGVWTGDRLVLLYEWGVPVKLTVLLTGIIDPIDPTEEYWFLKDDIFALPGSGDIDAEGPTAPLFIPEQTLFEGIGRLAVVGGVAAKTPPSL